MTLREFEVTRQTTYKVDPDELRDVFGKELAEDGVDIEDDDEVVVACWDNGVRDPYFVPTVWDDEERWLVPEWQRQASR